VHHDDEVRMEHGAWGMGHGVKYKYNPMLYALCPMPKMVSKVINAIRKPNMNKLLKGR
jgi:hypothetical protein